MLEVTDARSERMVADAGVHCRAPAQLAPGTAGGLAAWVFGAILAGSAGESAVIRALLTEGGKWDAWRARLREFLCAGTEKAAPCTTQGEVSACFPDLLRWVVEFWQEDVLPLAIDPTLDGDKLAALVISVLYRGCAIPVAWQILPANQEEPWLPHLVRLLGELKPAMPRSWQVVVLTDRGLWSPALWDAIREQGGHPLGRVRTDATVQPQGGKRQPVRALVPSPGQAWVGKGVASKHAPVRRPATLIVIWAHGQKDPWVC
ncbi:MAG: hypothetical protein ACR2PL_15485 [Dehalococcoidia bacterium]